MSTTDKTATSEPTTTVPNWDVIPCVQYGYPAGKGEVREPKLRTIFEPIPEDATTVSPVYLLTPDQYEHQQRFETGYEVADYTSIATQLQEECERKDRVLYFIHIESDSLRVEGPDTLLAWFREFVEEYLEVPFDTCTLYFSGSRSIHVHVPRFLSGEHQREQLKERAEQFCEDTGANLDCGIYDPKRLFRLPGVIHEKTGLPKVEIGKEWDDTYVCQQVRTTPLAPRTYEEVLRHVFISQEELIVSSARGQSYTPLDIFRILDRERAVLQFPSNEQERRVALVEQREYPSDPDDALQWLAYNAKEFSPYAFAAGNGRSVAALEVKGGAFARPDIRKGATMVPAYFYGARGCAGGEFIKDHEHAPLQLSNYDYAKWEYKEGDHVVIIGGQSRNSRIFPVDPCQAAAVGYLLTGEDGNRKAALEYLAEEGYDVGSAGSTAKSKSTRSNRSKAFDSSKRAVTGAAKLQRQAEKNGIETLGHKERWRVACRLLKQGWEPAWSWFKEQYGPTFKPDVTWTQFKSVVDYKPEDYQHVNVPAKPR